MVEQVSVAERAVSRRLHTKISYQAALNSYQTRRGLDRVSWVTWLIAAATIFVWCLTAYHAALDAGARGIPAIIGNILDNAINVQDKSNDAITNVLVAYGAKVNDLIIHGQYWRFVTPIFLHVNLLHIGLNMLNFVVLGVFLERMLGHTRFLLIYLVTGIISIIASFCFSPQEVSVGASGAIFGLVGAYSIFVLVHRRAFPRGGIPALLWLVLIVGINLSIGFFISNVDNYAHVGGLLSGFLLGWWFTPLYKFSPSQEKLVDAHRLSRRWPLVVLALLGTLIFAASAIHILGG